MKTTELELANAILRKASRFVGLKEVLPNAKWDNPKTPGPDTELSNELVAIMRPAPWKPGWAYCAAFVEGVVTQALRKLGATEQELARFTSRMSAHVLTGHRAFAAANVVTPGPAIGALWFARHGTTANGHAGLVVTGNGSAMETIEANTSAGPSVPAKEREGDWITRRTRNVRVNGSLRTLGFVTPGSLLRLVNG